MKVLLDEDVPRKLVRFLDRHQVHTVPGMKWGGVKNGQLLGLIERQAFEVFLTGDKNMPSQQRLAARPFAIIILTAINWPVIRPNVDAIVTAIDSAVPGTVRLIDCGTFGAPTNSSPDEPS